MTVLIVYDTVEGQTGKIVERAAARLRASGRDVRVVGTASAGATADFSDIERVILAAPVHERRHPPNFEAFVRAYRTDLAARPTLMLSVSLSAAFSETGEAAEDYLTEMEMRTGFTARRSALVAGAIKSSSYDYYKGMVVRHVLLKGRGPDPEAGEHEFTDWPALEADVDRFLVET